MTVAKEQLARALELVSKHDEAASQVKEKINQLGDKLRKREDDYVDHMRTGLAKLVKSFQELEERGSYRCRYPNWRPQDPAGAFSSSRHLLLSDRHPGLHICAYVLETLASWTTVGASIAMLRWNWSRGRPRALDSS